MRFLANISNYRGKAALSVGLLLLLPLLSPAWAANVNVLVSNFTDTPDPIIRGNNIVYSATVSNSADNVASGVVLTFQLDAGTQFVAASHAGCLHSTGTVTCIIGTLDTAPVTVDVTVKTTGATGSTANAIATVNAPLDTDTNIANNSLIQVTTVNSGADLGIMLTPYVKAVSGSTYSLINAPILAGSTIKYVLNTSNQGPDIAGITTVTLTLSPHLTYISTNASGWTCSKSGQQISCSRSSAAVATLPAIEVVAQITGSITGTLTSAAKIATSGEAADGNDANNSSAASIEVESGADLAITKSASPTLAVSGQAVVFTLAPRNKGSFPASNTVVTDTLPAGFVYQSAVGSGWSCDNNGQIVTCTTPSYAVGATKNITITATAPTVTNLTNYTNTAVVSSDLPDPDSSNNIGTANVAVSSDGITMTISKTRQLGAVAQGQTLTSTLVARYNGSSFAPIGSVSIVDTLPAGETYVGYSGVNWFCTQDAVNVQRISCVYNGTVAVGALTSNLTITTTATNSGTLTNSACVFYNTTQKACTTASTTSTPPVNSNDLQVAIVADKALVAWSDDTLTYTVTVTNNGPLAATGVVMKDTFRGYIAGTNSTVVTIAKTGGTSPAIFSCVNDGGSWSGLSVAGTYIYDWPMTCTQGNSSVAMGVGETAIFTVVVARPLAPSNVSPDPLGKWRNTARVYSTKQGDTNTGNNTASVDVQVEAASDLQVVNTVTPSSVEAGVNATYVVTVTNRGLATASGMTLSDVITPNAGGMTFVSATPSSGGSCLPFNVGTGTLSCTLPNLARNATATVTVVVQPDFLGAPPNPRTLTSVAAVAMAVNNDSNLANNSATATLTVIPASVDLLVNVSDNPDPIGYDPGSPATNVVTYKNTITNNGPSSASGLQMTFTMTPPAGNNVTFLGDKLTSGGAYSNYCNQINQPAIGPATLSVTCVWPGGVTLPDLAATNLYLDFRVDTSPNAAGVTLNTLATVSANEMDTKLANNSLAHTTSVKARADVEIVKDARDPTDTSDAFALAQDEPFLWKLTVTNHGPGDSYLTKVVDELSSDMGLNGAITASQGACSTAPGSYGRTIVTCNLGLVTSGNSATITIPVVSHGFNDQFNCANVETSAVDPNPTNNSGCDFVHVQGSTIDGYVYADDNPTNNVLDGGEPGRYARERVVLTGIDYLGNPVNQEIQTADGSLWPIPAGWYQFPDLKQGTYTVSLPGRSGVSAQAGSIGGTIAGVPRAVGVGVAGNNQITINLPGHTYSASNNFGIPPTNQSLSGYFYFDSNNNNQKDAGELPIVGATVELVGDSSGLVKATATTDATGAYHFNGLQTINQAGESAYTIRDASYSTGGVESSYAPTVQVGTGVSPDSNIVGFGIGVPSPLTSFIDHTFSIITIYDIHLKAGDQGVNYNFGFQGVSLAGTVYQDVDDDGTRNVVSGSLEPGIGGVAVTLSGNVRGSNANVCTVLASQGRSCTVHTSPTGDFVFAGLPASNNSGYQLVEAQPAGYVNRTDTPGSCYDVTVFAPATGQPTCGTPGLDGSGNSRISTIPLILGNPDADYLFGEKVLGGSIFGKVYFDRDNSRTYQTGEELSGVPLTLTGLDNTGAAVSRTTTTNPDGSYAFAGLQPSGSAGYTITETQPAGLGDFPGVEGVHVGTVAGQTLGTADPNVISQIKLPAGGIGIDYDFLERASTISGIVYRDNNDTGAKDTGETGINSVVVTLAGYGWGVNNADNGGAGDDVVITPITATTNASGAFSFSGLRRGTYVLTETQPVDFSDGKETAGSAGGNVDNSAFDNAAQHNRISAIVLAAGSDESEYLFGEKTLGTISGRVYHDPYDLKAYDTGGEIPGVAISLSGTDNSGNAVNKSTTTGVDGFYYFTSLPPTDNTSGYTIAETQPPGMGDFPNAEGSMVGTISGVSIGSSALNVLSGIKLPASGNGLKYDFRERASNISGYAYYDDNNNGLKDAEETGINGVKVTLTGYTWGANGTDDSGGGDDISIAPRMAFTDSNGGFLFLALFAGTYTLEETQPTMARDGKEKAGTSGGVIDNSVFDAAPAHNRISQIVLPAATDATGYLFGEGGGALRGFVYHDANNNGLKDSGEIGLPNIDVTLSGSILDGTDISTIRDCVATPANCKATTDGDGAFSFEGLLPGTYTLVEDHAQVSLILDAFGKPKYVDGKETVGLAGGVVDNSGFGNLPSYNTIGDIMLTRDIIAENNGAVGSYLFGERLFTPDISGRTRPRISGYVYVDQYHTRQRPGAVIDGRTAIGAYEQTSAANKDPYNPTTPPLMDEKSKETVSQWTITLKATKSGGSTEVICQLSTDENGFYQFDNLSCGSGWISGLPYTGMLAPSGGGTYQTFEISFSSGRPHGFSTVPQSNGNVGQADAANARIYNITLGQTDELTEQNLPIDPSGVVYDAITRLPVAGATVEFYHGGSFDAVTGLFNPAGATLVSPTCLVGGINTLVTDGTGFYQFLFDSAAVGIHFTCPAGQDRYTLRVTPPASYAQRTSSLIPPGSPALGPFSTPPLGLGGVYPVQAQNGPPTGGASTVYYLDMDITLDNNAALASDNIVNNHIPLDPLSSTAIRVIKTTPLVNVTRGDLVPYAITATNTTSSTINSIDVVDRLPPGFKYRKGSATLNGLKSEPNVNGSELTWPGLRFTGNEEKVFKMLLMVGSGVGDGEYNNCAWADRSPGGVYSNVACATVRVVPDPTFDCSDIIGKVFDDNNTNGYQDEGEPGIPNVRIATPRGLLVTTDAEGRFHVACADIPQADHGSNYVLKLDERTLPSGYRVTTENPRDVRTTRGKMVKLNFGAALHRVVRLDVSDDAFEPGSTTLKLEWQRQFEALPEMLKEQPSVLRLAYKPGAEGKPLAETRLKAISTRMQSLWKEKACCHLLQIEEELVSSPREGK